jgi:alkylation response protein AidB-like acyl-CoA dehydrogenase
MDFDLNSEQQQLADAIARWAEKDYGFEKRKQIISSDAGVSTAAWQALAELGVLALPVPSEHDGFDGTAIDQMVVMQALGSALLVEPVFATALGVQFLKLAGGHGDVLAKVKSQTETVLKTLDNAEARSRAMGRALKKVEGLPELQATGLIPMDKDFDSDDGHSHP